MEEKEKNFINRNIKLHPLYCALTWDVIFVWTISTMFFSTQKGLSYSQIISLDSILMIVACVMCIPLNKLFQNVKPVIATRIATLGYGVFILLCIIGTNYFVFALAQVFLAFGYVVNAIKVNSLLTNSLHLVGRDKEYDKIYGRGMAIFYVIEAVGAILITYVYSFNAYLAMWLSMIVVVIAELYSFLFHEPEVKQLDKNEPIKTSEKPDSYFKILASSFFIFLLIFMFLMRGTLSVVTSGFKVFLQQQTDANRIPLWSFGYIYAGIKIFAAISSKYQFKLNLKFGVRTLVIFSVLTILTYLINAFIILNFSMNALTITLVVLCTYLQGSLLMPCRIFVNNYMQLCISPKNIEKAYSIRIMAEYFGFALISAIYAGLLAKFGDNIGLTSLVFIGILAIPILVSMALFIRALIKQYANKRTLIKDEYTKDDYQTENNIQDE